MLKNLFDYKCWANDELLSMAAQHSHALPPDDWRQFVRILDHTYVVDRIFAGHLTGVAHGYVATVSQPAPELDALHQAVRESDAWYLRYVQEIGDAGLSDVIRFQFTDGQAGAMSRAEMLHHVVVHGTYHRGAAGRILAAHGIQPPRDSLTVFWHRTEPHRRLG